MMLLRSHVDLGVDVDEVDEVVGGSAVDGEVVMRHVVGEQMRLPDDNMTVEFRSVVEPPRRRPLPHTILVDDNQLDTPSALDS